VRERPNILYIMTDQQYAGAMSCAGNPSINTPNMDRLAERGMRFTKICGFNDAMLPGACADYFRRHASSGGERPAIKQHRHHFINHVFDFNWSTRLWRQFRWAYYRLIERVDTRIGQVLDALETSGFADDTLLVFSSDHSDMHGGPVPVRALRLQRRRRRPRAARRGVSCQGCGALTVAHGTAAGWMR